MLEKYIDWDEVAIKALRHHNEAVIALDNLREEYAAITNGLGAVDYGKDRIACSSDADSSMVNRMLQKSNLEDRIKQLMKDEKVYQKAWDGLAEDEQRVLTEFFQRGRRPAQAAVDALCDLYGYERANIYNLRKAAIQRFKRLLIG